VSDNKALVAGHAASQIFFFAPQRKWYLVFQAGAPQYSTTDDITKPETWTAPHDFFAAGPAAAPRGPKT
jgi:Glycosyl hydrolase family 62